MGEGWRSHALVILGYLALYYLFTYPALHTFASLYLCDAGDGLQNVWNMWWIKTAVESGQNPWVTDRLFYPDGITLEVQVPNTTVPLQLMQVVQSMASEAVNFVFGTQAGFPFLSHFRNASSSEPQCPKATKARPI